jgi:type IV pilus assembly protein PilC
MAFIITPAQLEIRSELYHQIAAMTSAGLGLLPALEMLERNPPSRSLRKQLQKLIDALQRGNTFAEALLQTSKWLPSFDIALLEAGEKSGRLDACFRLLADYYRDHAKMVRQVMSDLMYPVFVVHFAIILFPTSMMVSAVLGTGGSQFLAAKLSAFVPLYLITFGMIYACQGRHGFFWRSLVEKVFNFIPILRTARKSLALARLSAALEALISAGVLLPEAWQMAAMSSGSPSLQKAIARTKPRLAAGETPGEILAKLKEFPEMFSNLYRTAEVSGKIDTTLLRLRDHYLEEGSRKMRALAQWLPKLIYLIIALSIAQQIVSFYSGYFNQVNEITQ